MMKNLESFIAGSPLDQFQVLLFNPWGENLNLGVSDLGGFFTLLQVGFFEFAYYVLLLPLGMISSQFTFLWSILNGVFSDDMSILAGLTTVTGEMSSDVSMLGVFPEVFFSSFTLAILLTFLSSMSFMLLTTYNSSVVPGRWQSVMEMYYSFILSMVCEIIGPKHGEKYFNSIFTLHLFVLWANLLALFPYTWSVTSQLAVTFTLAVLAFSVVNVIGFLHHGVHLLSLFCPKGAGLGLGSAIVIIEFVAYLIRVVSLGVRLFANIMGGHTLLKIVCVFIWFVFSIGGFMWIASSFALCLVFAINVLELMVAMIQAYVFSLLLTVYLGDVLDPAH